MSQEKNYSPDKNRWTGHPKLSTDALVKVTRKVLQIMGRDFDAEFEEYKNEQLMIHVRDEVADV